MLIYLIRHAPVEVPSGTCYGSTDVALAPDWREQLESIRHKLPMDQVGEDNVYSSPLQRCLILARGLTPNPHVDERLKEMHYGGWEGRLWSEIPRAETTTWLSDLENVHTPDGESLGDVYQRGVECLVEIAETATDPVFVMTHGAMIRCLVVFALGMPLNHAARIQIDYGGVSRLRFEADRKHLECMNV